MTGEEARTEVRSALLERAISRMRSAWRDLTSQGRLPSRAPVRADLPDDDLPTLKRQIAACVEGAGGEVSARARAAELGRVYLSLSGSGKERFFNLLARDFGVDDEVVNAAVEALKRAGDAEARLRAQARLRAALTPPYVGLLAQFNGLPSGVKFVVDLRTELRETVGDDPHLRALDDNLRELLTGWFDIGLLRLERITWHAPAALLEKLAAYEAVHRVRSWQDLKNRLDSDRRFYAFFHPSMPDEPLIFVEVALVDGLADNIQALLDRDAPADDPKSANAAIFYSISNAQRGLVGLSFGGFLIKRVLDDLSRELPTLKTFATLSPLPGFRNWVERRIAAGDDTLLTAPAAKALRAFEPDAASTAELLGKLLDGPWHRNEALSDALEAPMLRLAARYLLTAKQGNEPLDRVARFHLNNGARVERLNWRGDNSPNGLKQSFGLMVNYRYRPEEIEANHEAYRGEGRIAAAPAVRALLG
ncbi:MAG: malonyl-CoA decarboxylase [Alphaproteobacteria bacterium]